MKKEIRSKLKKHFVELLESLEDFKSFSYYTFLTFHFDLNEAQEKYPNINFDRLLTRWEKEWKRNKNEKN